MAHPHNEKCLILKKTKLGENDLILSLLTDQGIQIRAVAKGARKPGNKRFGARVEPFSLIAVQLYPGKSLENITELTLLESHASCRESLEKTSSATLVCEFLEKFTRDGEVGSKVFFLSVAYFQKLSCVELSQLSILTGAFFVKAFALLGYKPALQECAVCSEPIESPAHFDISLGGALCQNCFVQETESLFDAQFVSWLIFLLYSTFDAILEAQDCPVEELTRFIELWLIEHMGLHLKSFLLFKTML